ncbi:MAG: ACT domain-containing protein [Limnochordaceae bacterium]|nr:ACT domain-containing protein [Limnochordaceae bacterium]
MESEKASGAGNSPQRLTLEAWASSSPASGSPEESKNKIVVTVLGKDRIGIIARVTGVLAQHHVNILDISQTIFGELFSMTLIGDIGRADIPFVELKRELVAAGQELGVRVLIQRQEVFERMHRP